MIITDARSILTEAPFAGPGWASLARRGMLWSEVQVFDVSVVQPNGPPLTSDGDYIDLLYCAAGSAVADRHGEAIGGSAPLLAGQLLICLPGRTTWSIKAEPPDNAIIIRARTLPLATSRALPPRQPGMATP